MDLESWVNRFRKLGREGNGWGGERESYLAWSSWLKLNEFLTNFFKISFTMNSILLNKFYYE